MNPWIYDFKAFDFWMKPLGLLYIASILREEGFEISFIDLLDRYHPIFIKRVKKRPRVDEYGRGKFYCEEIKKPEVLSPIPRRYKRYGMPVEVFLEILDDVKEPDVILLTSMMTYWYLGVWEAIKILKRRFKGVPIILGGVYPTLMPGHAKLSGADIIIPGLAEENLFRGLRELGLVKEEKRFHFTDLPFPAFDLYSHLDYACVLTSRGCPFHCTYCAVPMLFNGFRVRDADSVYKEIEYYAEVLKVENIAFYDDALLLNPHFHKLLDKLIARGLNIKFHTPNGLFPRFITEELAFKFYEVGFETIYLSLETIEPARQRATGDKVRTEEFLRAVELLKGAGFKGSQIHTYLMMGLPGQPAEEVKRSINFVNSLGIRVHLSEFSPIPRTLEFKRAGYDDETDPLLHNNTAFGSYEEKLSLKRYLLQIQQKQLSSVQ